MTSPEIEHYWQEYERLLDRHVSDPETPSTMREIREGLNQLVERVEREISESHEETLQLSLWASTFHRLAAELALDLDQVREAVASYRKAVEHHWDDLETRVGLIRALDKQRAWEKAGVEISRLNQLGNAFTSSGDPESAAKVLEILCRNQTMAQQVEPSVIWDALQAVAARFNMRVLEAETDSPKADSG